MREQKRRVIAGFILAFTSVVSNASATFAKTDWAGKASAIKTTGLYLPQAELSSGTTGGFFGDSVAVWRDAVTGTEWIVVGALSDESYEGAAYVYSLSSGDKAWRQEAKLIADDATGSDEFGYAVAIDHDTVVVGAPFHEKDLLTGAVYVFVRDTTTGAWNKQGDTLMRGDSNFGMSVAIAGNELGVGEPDRESVHLYLRTAGVWSFDTVVTSSDVSLGSAFGQAVAFDGSRLIVGAPGDSTIAAIQGAALVYSASSSGWNLEGVWRPAADTSSYELFGSSVALMGDTAVVGAPWQDDFKGAAHVFVYDGAGWNETHVIDAADGIKSAGFGSSVAVAADTIAVGAPGDNRAYLYGLQGAAWTLVSEMSDSAKTIFGSSVAADGHLLVVGAAETDGSAGRTHVFLNDRIFADGIE